MFGFAICHLPLEFHRVSIVSILYPVFSSCILSIRSILSPISGQGAKRREKEEEATATAAAEREEEEKLREEKRVDHRPALCAVCS